jgi:hypothetical protein
MRAVYGYANIFLVGNDQSVQARGKNLESSLGLGWPGPVNEQTSSVDLPFQHQTIVQIVGGEAVSIVLTSEGKCYASGSLEGGLNARKNGSFASVREPRFVELDWFDGMKIDQIACGLNHAAVVINAPPPPCVQRLFSPLETLKISDKARTIVAPDGLWIVDGRAAFSKFGFCPGDIFQFSEIERCLLIGVSRSDRSMAAVIREINRAPLTIPLTRIGDLKLLSRRDKPLTPVSIEGETFYIDTDFFPDGIQSGDLVPGGATVIGSAGLKLFARAPDGSHSLVPIHNLRLMRGNLELMSMDVVGGAIPVFAERIGERQLVLHRYFGAGILRGRRSDGLLVQFACDGTNGRFIGLTDDSLNLWHSDDVECFTEGMESITVSRLTPRALDLVETPAGLGTVAGIAPDGKIAVWCEENQSCYGTVKLFDETEVRSVARIFGELHVDGMSVNSADFAEFSVLPRDVLLDGTVVLGLKEGKIVGRTVKGDLRNVDGNSEVAVRHIFALATRFDRFVSVFNLPPGHSRLLGVRTKSGVVVAATATRLLIRDDEGTMRECRSVFASEAVD